MQILDVEQAGTGSSVRSTASANTGPATATMMRSAWKTFFADTTTAEPSGVMQSLRLIAVFQVQHPLTYCKTKGAKRFDFQRGFRI